MKKILNVPNVLTISRIIALPFFAAGFFIDSKIGILLSLSIFVLCCVTDFLDGYYARTYKQTTKFGQMLDPMADKLLVSVTILFIVGFRFVSVWSIIPAAIILCREIIVSVVRDTVVQNRVPFKTSLLAKWKTALQMVSISLIMCSRIFNIFWLSDVGELLFWISAVIATLSGIIYCKHHMSMLV